MRDCSMYVVYLAYHAPMLRLKESALPSAYTDCHPETWLLPSAGKDTSLPPRKMCHFKINHRQD